MAGEASQFIGKRIDLGRGGVTATIIKIFYQDGQWTVRYERNGIGGYGRIYVDTLDALQRHLV